MYDRDKYDVEDYVVDPLFEGLDNIARASIESFKMELEDVWIPMLMTGIQFTFKLGQRYDLYIIDATGWPVMVPDVIFIGRKDGVGRFLHIATYPTILHDIHVIMTARTHK